MILLDANLLVYACAPSLPLHDRARAWLDARLSGPERVGLPWASLLAFVRVVSKSSWRSELVRPCPTISSPRAPIRSMICDTDRKRSN